MSHALKPLPEGFTRASTQTGTESFWGKRLTALDELPMADDVRRRAREVRLEALRHLDTYLEQAIAQLRGRGAQVHFAADADEAKQIALQICQAAGARRVVKGKSMVTEEVHLNPALEAAGLEVVETDLGEYIVQIAHEIPSHIIAPALHKSRAEIQALFEREAGEELSPETSELAAFARRHLREKFLTADVGITGGNFVVAETGTVAIVTNEGNGRMCSSVPRVHIVMTGIEKIVPKLADLGPLLAVLPRSATGQRLTVYTHMMSGPRQPGELDGPEEMHVIFLDNGRTNLLGSEFEEVLTCIRCGACLNTCPVYRQSGGHAYGSPYSGPIGAVISPLYWGMEEFGHLAHASSLCGACYEVCPVGIHLHDHLLRLRRLEVQQQRPPLLERLTFAAWGFLWSRPWAYQASLKLGRALQGPFRTAKGLENLPGPFAPWTQGRTFPAMGPQTFSERWGSLQAELAAQHPKSEVSGRG